MNSYAAAEGEAPYLTGSVLLYDNVAESTNYNKFALAIGDNNKGVCLIPDSTNTALIVKVFNVANPLTMV